MKYKNKSVDEQVKNRKFHSWMRGAVSCLLVAFLLFACGFSFAGQITNEQKDRLEEYFRNNSKFASLLPNITSLMNTVNVENQARWNNFFTQYDNALLVINVGNKLMNTQDWEAAKDIIKKLTGTVVSKISPNLGKFLSWVGWAQTAMQLFKGLVLDQLINARMVDIYITNRDRGFSPADSVRSFVGDPSYIEAVKSFNEIYPYTANEEKTDVIPRWKDRFLEYYVVPYENQYQNKKAREQAEESLREMERRRAELERQLLEFLKQQEFAESEIEALLITPQTISLKVGESRQFFVRALLKGGAGAMDVSSDPALDWVPSRTFKAEKPGTFKVTVSYAGVHTVTATVRVVESDNVSTLSITPSNRTIRIGERINLTVIAVYESGRSENVTQDALANPVFRGNAPGTFRVVANFGSKTAVAVITVEEGQKDIDEALGEIPPVEPEDEEEDICDPNYVWGLVSRLNDLVSNVTIKNGRFMAFYRKFEKEINDQNAAPCTNGMVGYCFYHALELGQEIEGLVNEVRELSTEIVMLLGICPGLSEQMQQQGFTLQDLVRSIAGIGGHEDKLDYMHTRLSERGCDEQEVQQNGENILPSQVDPDFLQDGGGMVEVPGDGIDNDADGLQDENQEVLAGYNVTFTVFDSGSAKDDSFSLSVNGFGNLGITPKGGLRSFGLNLPPGAYTATVSVITAPDNVGTFTLVIQENGVQIAALTGAPPEGGVAILPFTVTGNR